MNDPIITLEEGMTIKLNRPIRTIDEGNTIKLDGPIGMLKGLEGALGVPSALD